MSSLCWIILAVLSLLLLLFNLAKKQSSFRLPPGPASLPIVGSLTFWTSRDQRQLMKSLQMKYGDVFTVHIGLNRVVVLSGFDAIKEALKTRSEVFGDRPDIYAVTEISQRMGIMSAEGDLLKQQKRFTLHVLRSCGFGESLSEDKIQEEAHHFLVELDSLDCTQFNPLYLFKCVTFNILSICILGGRMNYSSAEMKDQIDALTQAVELSGQVNSFLLPYPFLRYLPWDFSKSAKLQQCFANIRHQHWRLIHNHKEQLCSTEEPKNLIDAYLRMIEKERRNTKSTFTETQLLHIIEDLYGAGLAAISTTLCWAMVFLLNHPEVLQRCQDEIDAIVGNSCYPSMQDRLKMPYMEATMMEIQRRGNIVPFTNPHATNKDVDFRGYCIPKGTIIFLDLQSVFTDERYFPNPARFDPGRFLNDDGSVKRIEQMIPFSIGPRRCPGEGLARTVLFRVLTSLLQHFTPALPDGSKPPNMDGTFHVFNRPDDFEVLFVRRK